MRKDYKTEQAALTDLNWDGNIEEVLPNIGYGDSIFDSVKYKIFVITMWLDACSNNDADGVSTYTLNEYTINFDEWLKETWRINNGN